jgi:N-acetylmuramoyl-L-alanine amidase
MTFDEQIAARTMWGEARGEPDDGQRAVAHVLVNRMRDGRWGANLASVCLSPSQFSCWGAFDPNRKKMAALADDDPALAHFAELIRNATIGTDMDPTQGATHYCAVSIPPPAWATGAVASGSFVQIGNHRFFREVQ